MEFLKWGQKQVRQLALNLTDTEVLVEEATNNEPWGPHGRDMAKISEASMDPEKYREIMTVIARRLTDAPENWRHIYKALLLLEYLVKHGPMKVARDTLSNTSLLIQLQSFDYKDEMGRDHGLNVRNRSKELLALVSDADRLAEARESARINRGKYTGTSKEDMKFQTSTGNYSQALPKRVVYEDKTEDTDNPFEATRKRIEKLKAEKEVPMKLKVPQQKEAKKLSQVKVNPEIAKTFMKPGQFAAKPSTEAPSEETQSPSFKPASEPMDLLGDLMDDHVSTQSAPDVFDGLSDPIHNPIADPISSAPVTSQTDGDDWAAFQGSSVQVHSHPQPQPTAHPKIALPDLLSQDGTSLAPMSGASMSMVKPVTMNRDPFADLCMTQQKPGIPMGAPVTQTQLPSSSIAQEKPQWRPPMTQQTSIPSTGFQAAAWMRQPGAPMNPNAVPPQRTAPKHDPFANLGF